MQQTVEGFLSFDIGLGQLRGGGEICGIAKPPQKMSLLSLESKLGLKTHTSLIFRLFCFDNFGSQYYQININFCHSK